MNNDIKKKEMPSFDTIDGAVSKQLFKVFLEVGVVVQGAVAALLTLRRSEQNVLVCIVPAYLVRRSGTPT